MTELHPVRTEHIAVEIAEEIARATGADPLALETPLYDVVDTEALERLADADATVRVAFEYDGHVVDVEIGDAGRVAVDISTRGER